MTLQNLKYMLEISNSHSFSKAAKNLFVSQSTLSAAVKELESDLGITIFKRTNRGVSLTYDGEDFIKYAKEIVEQSQYLEQRYHARKSLPMRFSVSCQHLPSAVRAFTSFLAEINSPTYDIAIRECDTNSVIHDVAGRKSELGVVAIHEPHMRSMQTLFSSYDIEFHEIKSVKNYVFLRFGHPLASLPVLSIKDLEKYPFVTYDQELETSHFSEEPLFYKLLNKMSMSVTAAQRLLLFEKQTVSVLVRIFLTVTQMHFIRGWEILSQSLWKMISDCFILVT